MAHIQRRRRLRVVWCAATLAAAVWLAAAGAWGPRGAGSFPTRGAVAGDVAPAEQPDSAALYAALPPQARSAEVSPVAPSSAAVIRKVAADGAAGESYIGRSDAGLAVLVVHFDAASVTDGGWELSLYLRVRNEGSSVLTITPLDFSLRDRSGGLWSGMAARSASSAAFPAASLAPGDEVEGWRRFDLPAAVTEPTLVATIDGARSAVEVGLPALRVPMDHPAGESGAQLAEEAEVAGGDS